MKMFACRDMGFDCDFIAKGETNEEVFKRLDEHGETAHSTEMKDMNMSKEEMRGMIMSKIVEI